MSQKVDVLLKEYLSANQYKEYNEVLRKEITIFFVKKIQKKNRNFLYSTHIELLEASEIYLNQKYESLFRKFHEVLKLNIDEKVRSERLMEIYKELV